MLGWEHLLVLGRTREWWLSNNSQTVSQKKLHIWMAYAINQVLKTIQESMFFEQRFMDVFSVYPGVFPPRKGTHYLRLRNSKNKNKH